MALLYHRDPRAALAGEPFRPSLAWVHGSEPLHFCAAKRQERMVSYGPDPSASSAALASQPGHRLAETPPAAGRVRCCRAVRCPDLLPRHARSGDAALLSPRISGLLAAGAGAADRHAVSGQAALALAVLLACQPARAA